MQIKVSHNTPYGNMANTAEKKLLNAIFEEKVVTVHIPRDADKIILIRDCDDEEDDDGG